MYSLRARFVLFGLVLFVVLGANSCKQEQESRGKTVKLSCGDKTVDVDPNIGASPRAVYICDDDTVIWNPHNHKFKVEFKQDSPFLNDEKAFDNPHSKSSGAKHFKELTVYEYKITVDGKEFDPQVIGGGGN